MKMDIRLPIGLMFLVVGVLLFVAGLTAKAEELQRSLGINIDLIWGLVLVVFGALMLLLAWRASKAAPEPPAEKK